MSIFSCDSFAYAQAVNLENMSDEQIISYINSISTKNLSNKNRELLETYAQSFIKNSRNNSAEHIYKFLLSKDPSKKKAFLYNISLGDIFANAKDYSQGLLFYDAARRLYDDNIQVKYKMGDILFESGLYALAQNYYLEALKIDKKKDYAKTRLGYIHFLDRDYQTALEYYEGINKDYYDENIVEVMANIYRKVNGPDYAADFLQKYIANYNTAEMNLMMGKFYYSDRDYDKAQRYLLYAIDKDEQLFEAYLYLADINISYKNDLKTAKEFLNKAVSINSSYPSIDIMLSRIAYKEGNKSLAKTLATSAYKKSKTPFVSQISDKLRQSYN
jgi:tetratricopeptide (TPR) repeat protein